MIPSLLLAPGISSCLVLSITAQDGIIQPVTVASMTTAQSIETLVTPLPAPSNPSILEIEIPTSTIESISTPASAASSTAFAGDDTYVLLGCFNEPPAISSMRALGATGDYLSPIFASQEALTVPLCLGACGVALAPNSSGPYTYAGVENSRECYCGLTLSPLSQRLHPPRASRLATQAQARLTPTNAPPSFLGGFSLLHPSLKRQHTYPRPVNAVYTSDGRRFGIVVDDAATDAETYVSPLEEDPVLGRKATRYRSGFEEWKSGVVSPVKVRVPVDPEAVGRSVELDGVVSPVGVGASPTTLRLGPKVDSESKVGSVPAAAAGVEQRGYETPIAELPASALPVSVDDRERGSVDFGGAREERPGLDNRELERRLKELGGLSPVSEVSGFTSRMSEADVDGRPEDVVQR
ncbi:hypothetical protein VTL71DRAFT_15682 [Oculimacula yallundae]|uniref:WSC domain-containing protein n=1 Tax=Oculimacula yallundae TaxID=86028 RepID=A0ABR4CHV4_9HELO